MTWSPATPAEPTPIDGTTIEPKQVLYEYDGPTIFTAEVGLSDVLFHKFDETRQHEFFVARPTNAEIVGALRDGTLSVRGALDGDEYWVIQTAGNLNVERVWKVSEFDFPLRLLPARRHGLFHESNPVPDTIEQATGFFSVKYDGPAFSRQSISFRKMKSLLGEVYDVASAYLLPTLGKISKFSVTDFEVAPLRFASLLISIKRPVVLEDAIRRRGLGGVASTSGIAGQIREQRDTLMDGMEEVVTEAAKRDLSTGFAGDHLTWIAALNALAPSRDDDVNYVEVTASEAGRARLLVIDETTAARIKGAHSEMTRAHVTLRGNIVEVNSDASTFVFRANNVRQTLCVWDVREFEAALASGELVVGANIVARGVYTRRQRRDRLDAQSVTFV